MSSIDDDRPRGKRSGKKAKKDGGSKTLLLAGCLGCGGLAGLGTVAGVVLLIVFGPFGGGVAKGLLNDGAAGALAPRLPLRKETFEKIAIGMTRAEVEKLLGPGRPATDADLDRAYPKEAREPGEALPWDWRDHAHMGQVTSWTEWRSGSDILHVGYAATRLGDLASVKLVTFAERGGNVTLSDVQPGDQLAAGREAKARDAKFVADPKWVKGAEIRKLAIGKWQLEKRAGFYDFAADGSLTTSIGAGRYQFRSDDLVDISLPDFVSGKLITNQFKVLITPNELVLAGPAGNIFVPVEFFRRDGKGPAIK